MRKYLAMLDNGHDYTSIEYYSEHRNGSKANLEDCKREALKSKLKRRTRRRFIMP